MDLSSSDIWKADCYVLHNAVARGDESEVLNGLRNGADPNLIDEVWNSTVVVLYSTVQESASARACRCVLIRLIREGCGSSCHSLLSPLCFILLLFATLGHSSWPNVLVYVALSSLSSLSMRYVLDGEPHYMLHHF
jgi:hypothetical protein